MPAFTWEPRGSKQCFGSGLLGSWCHSIGSAALRTTGLDAFAPLGSLVHSPRTAERSQAPTYFANWIKCKSLYCGKVSGSSKTSNMNFLWREWLLPDYLQAQVQHKPGLYWWGLGSCDRAQHADWGLGELPGNEGWGDEPQWALLLGAYCPFSVLGGNCAGRGFSTSQTGG